MIIAFAGIVLMISEGLALGEFFGNIMALGTALFFSCFGGQSLQANAEP